MLVEASKLTDDKNWANFFEAEKKVRFFFGVISRSALALDALREITRKKIGLFSASKKFAKFLSSVNLLASTNKTALLYTLGWQFYLEKSKKIKKNTASYIVALFMTLEYQMAGLGTFLG